MLLQNPGIPSPTSPTFTVGPVTLHFYAVFILTGIIAALIVGGRRLKARGGEAGLVLDIALWAVPFGIVGGRIFHVATHIGDYFGPNTNVMSVFYIWQGGLAIYGAIAFGLLGAWIGARFAGLRLMTFIDIIIPGVILAQGIGRWGNYFNQELFGLPTNLPWGIQITNSMVATDLNFAEGTIFHPIFFYEFLFDVAGFFLLIFLDKKFELRWGKLFATYLVYYSTVRFWLEGMRVDPSAYFLSLRTNQWSAIVGVTVGIALFLYLKRRHTGIEPSVYAREPESKQ